SDHKFPIQKYKLIPEKLLDENVISEANLFIPSMAKREIVELTHTSEYIRRERKGFYIQHAR
ncbi:MAG: hypothetical protein K9J16_11880, partial [Melioribacteraceae bacterium]|nr:hypothetical protein [Melioribacteraceae bacterium]